MKKSIILTAIAATLSLPAIVSCEEETDNEVSAFTYDFVNVYTDADGYGSVLQNDRGRRYMITDTVIHLVPDTLYRLICSYEVRADSTQAYVLGYSEIISCLPMDSSEVMNKLVEDPLEMQSAWISGGYLNVIWNVLAKKGGHSLFPVDSSTEDGVRITMYHDENDDLRSYTMHGYMSTPLSQYNLESGDTITLSYKDYDGKSVDKKLVMR